MDGRALPPPSGLRHKPIHCCAIFNRKLIFGLKYFNSRTREPTRVCCAQLARAASNVKKNCVIVCCSISATDSYKKPGKRFLLRMGPFPVDGHIYIFPGQCHTVISNLAITRIILNPFYNAAVYIAYSEPTMHCILLVISMWGDIKYP